TWCASTTARTTPRSSARPCTARFDPAAQAIAAMPTPRTLDDWLDYIERQHPKAIDMGLDRVREVAQRMGLGKPARQVALVGGTNGKGSTVAFIEAIARAAGLRTGAYT